VATANEDRIDRTLPQQNPGLGVPLSGGYAETRSRELLKKHRGTREKRLAAAERMEDASQWRLIVQRFRKHKVAVVSIWILIALYLMAILAEFVAPYDQNSRFDEYLFAPPSNIHWFHEGSFEGPFIYSTVAELDMTDFSYTTVEDPEGDRHPIRLWVESEPYELLGIIPMEHKLFGVESEDQAFFLLGADHLGRDLFSRIVNAARISLFIGLAGVTVSFVIGIVLGGISGYFGGVTDTIIQRVIEFLMSIPQIPLWMGLSAAIPSGWSGVRTFFAITLILSVVGWTDLARVVRGKVISLREEDYVTAARISSARPMQIIGRHLLPGVTSYLIVSLTGAIPAMILGETSLSFLGLGITAPDVSWGSLLQQAQDVVVVSNYPWLLIPAAFVMAVVILFNFIGDGLRDAADPYSR
jgi:peptide/nickel transport system permease protein